MKALLCLALLFFAPMLSTAAERPMPFESTPLPGDARKSAPNNPAPPARRIPHTVLPPLPVQEEGIIRRVHLSDARKVVALTFDLCELSVVTTGYDLAIINFLNENSIPATLFMGGKWMRTHAERVMQLMGNPLFEIGNHAWSHGNFGIMDAAAMREQVRWTQAQYELLREELIQRRHKTGQAQPVLPPCPTLFRLPYGRTSEAALTLLAHEGLQVIQWDVVAELKEDNTLPGLEKNVLMHVKPGSILLFHANLVPKGSAVLLQRTVHAMQAQGYSFVSVGQLLQMGVAERTRDGYFSVPGDNLALDKQFGIDGTGKK